MCSGLHGAARNVCDLRVRGGMIKAMKDSVEGPDHDEGFQFTSSKADAPSRFPPCAEIAVCSKRSMFELCELHNISREEDAEAKEKSHPNPSAQTTRLAGQWFVLGAAPAY